MEALPVLLVALFAVYMTQPGKYCHNVLIYYSNSCCPRANRKKEGGNSRSVRIAQLPCVWCCVYCCLCAFGAILKLCLVRTEGSECDLESECCLGFRNSLK